MSSSIFAGVTAEKVRALRDEGFGGMGCCRRHLMDQAVDATILDLLEEGVIDHRLQQVLTYLLER